MNKKAIFIVIVFSLLVFLYHVPCGYTEDPHIGVLMSSNIPYFEDIHKSFTKELVAKGIKADIAVQKPAPDILAWANAARKFVAFNMDAIVTYGTPATQAVLSETSKIPVVFAGIHESKTLGSKGGNVTGVTGNVSVAALLKTLKGIKNFSTLGILYNSTEKSTLNEVAEIERLSGQLSFKPVKFNIRKNEDISNINNVDAIYITSSCMAAMCVNDIVRIARTQKIPTAASIGGLEEKGILLTLFADPELQGKAVAQMLSRILKGENPSSIPEESTQKIQLVINLREASSLGLSVPFDIISVATKVIK